HYFTPIIARDGAYHVAKIFKARYQTARRRGSVSHFLRDGRHSENFFLIEARKKEKLWERNVAGRKLFAQAQHKAALKFQNDVGKPLCIRKNLISLTSCKRCEHSRIQGH